MLSPGYLLHLDRLLSLTQGEDGIDGMDVSQRWVGRVLHPRSRTVLLILLTVVLAAAAVIVGLPSPPSPPSGLGRLTVVPVLPEDPQQLSEYRLTVSFGDQRGAVVTDSRASSSGLLWDTYRDDGRDGASTDPVTMSGPPVYVAVQDDETATWLRACVGTKDAQVTEVDSMPAAQRQLLDRFDQQDYGAQRDYSVFRLDDLGVVDGWWFSTCPSPPGATTTGDGLEVHSALPELTVLLPSLDDLAPAVSTEADGGRSVPDGSSVPEGPEGRTQASDVLPGIAVHAYVEALPTGWSDTQLRSLHGVAEPSQSAQYWNAVLEDPTQEAGLSVLRVGPVSADALSWVAAREAERDLFWSGLLVGLAATFAIMLFETIPWRREDTP